MLGCFYSCYWIGFLKFRFRVLSLLCWQLQRKVCCLAILGRGVRFNLLVIVLVLVVNFVLEGGTFLGGGVWWSYMWGWNFFPWCLLFICVKAFSVDFAIFYTKQLFGYSFLCMVVCFVQFVNYIWKWIDMCCGFFVASGCGV